MGSCGELRPGVHAVSLVAEVAHGQLRGQMLRRSSSELGFRSIKPSHHPDTTVGPQGLDPKARLPRTSFSAGNAGSEGPRSPL
jgi:hypothetical protein